MSLGIILWNSASDILPFAFALSTAPPTVRIVHSGHACNVEEERYTERVYTIREGETLELTCLVTGHPRPQVRLLYSSATYRLSLIMLKLCPSFKRISLWIRSVCNIFIFLSHSNAMSSQFLSSGTHFQNTKNKTKC